MADENIIIEGNVKFRDGKKWKSRWCVMRRLSPVADCVQVQVWRDWRARAAAAPGGCKAALSLEKFLGCEAGFTLDKHSHTLALVCRDLVAVLAFDTRERLMQWQVKVCNQLGEPRQYLVLVGGGGGRRLPAGPARLHLHEDRFALTAGVPPRLLGVWELQHLRRYGVVEGRFCFEGGSLCGKGEGLHVLVSDQARDIARDFELASQGRLSPKRRPNADRRNNGAESPRSHKAYRPDTRLSELSAEGAGGAGGAEEAWPATELGLGDAASLGEPADSEGPWAGAGASLERCVSCMSKLGALSRSSTAALTPGAKHFNPAWTMEAVQESSERACECPPERPPRPLTLTLGRKPRPAEDARSTGVGPYENYDVPRVPSSEAGEYYDTPKRLKECVDSELFRMSRGGAGGGGGGGVVLAKPCGCLLRLARRPAAAAADDGPPPPPACPCRRVTDWANSWIRFPYCKRNVTNGDTIALDKENMVPTVDEHSALYAKIDLSRKVNRKLGAASDRSGPITAPESRTDPKSIQIDNGPLANYENLSFALSLEHYENAKDLLRSAGVTQAELNAISANLKPSSFTSVSEERSCTKCGHHRPRDREADSSNDDYLMMEPASIDLSKGSAPPAGYTPMSPIGGFAFYTLRQRARSPVGGLPAEKSASNPALCDGSGERAATAAGPPLEPRQRSSSADSSRFLDEREETNEARGSASSLETLRGAGGAPTSCGCRGGKHSDGDSSEASRARRSAGAVAAGTRDSSSSNDSGVSSWSRRAGACYETPRTTAQARRHYRTARRPPPPARPPRRARSLGETPSPSPDPAQPPPQNKSSSAEAEVPLLSMRLLRGGTICGLADAHSTSSGASDMSDYIETLSLCSSHSSTDTPVTMRVSRQMTSTLRPRSGKEYLNLDARLATMRRPPQPPAAVHGAHASHAGHAAHASHAAHAGLGSQPPRLPQRQPYTNLP